MLIRKPAVAGQFYPGGRQDCINEIEEYLSAANITTPLPETIVSAIVPHAGWVFSGDLACKAFAAIKKQNKEVNTFVIFGTPHSYFSDLPAVYNFGKWITPLGEIDIDDDLAEKVIKTGIALSNTSVHRNEHSIEVQVPIIQHLFPTAKILPILMPPTVQSIEMAEELGDILQRLNKKVVCIGSTDLTHYGPRYGFEPVGVGIDAIQWSSKVNDKKFIDAALKMVSRDLLLTTAEHCNACGPGAAAAAVSVATILGRQHGVILAQSNSYEVMVKKMGTTSDDCVGYVSIVY
jgi:AmmeMemoRadiSam system protein B